MSCLQRRHVVLIVMSRSPSVRPPTSCPGNEYSGNQVWWVKSNGTASPMWLSHNYPVTDVHNGKQVTSLNPARLRVIL